MSEYITAVNIVGSIMMALIVIIYGFATYWNFAFFIRTKGKYDSVLMVYTSFATLIFCGIYIYLFSEALIGHFHDITLFGTIVLRPAVLLLGGSIASMARARYLSLKNGGVQWILPKYKE